LPSPGTFAKGTPAGAPVVRIGPETPMQIDVSRYRVKLAETEA
jgi:hypothetical protein